MAIDGRDNRAGTLCQYSLRPHNGGNDPHLATIKVINKSLVPRILGHLESKENRSLLNLR